MNKCTHRNEKVHKIISVLQQIMLECLTSMGLSVTESVAAAQSTTTKIRVS